jgi:2-polyprenyl-6-methoxyphenol hydroxylase-like FAD-dependent oxidoreductase
MRKFLKQICVSGLFLLIFTHALSGPGRPIRRIAIIGSGISGLSVAHALVNNPDRPNGQFSTVDIFDARPSLDTTAGAGIQLNGGLAVLGRINPKLQKAVWDAGLPTVRVQSNSKSWFPPSSSKTEFNRLLEINIKETILAEGGEVAASLIDTQSTEHRVLWICIMRGALQQALLDQLPRNKKVQFKKRLTKLVEVTGDDGVSCQFADGSSSGPYDLVIGCEGINSLGRTYVSSSSRSRLEKINDDRFKTAIYSGIRIRYAVSDKGDPKTIDSTLSQYFGVGAYALDCVYGNGKGRRPAKSAFIVYLDPNYIGPFRKRASAVSTTTATTIGENVDWSQDNRQKLDVARQGMLKQLQKCGIPQSSDDSLGQTIVEADRFFELGVYFHNPFSKWSRSVGDRSDSAHVVLCGDAAHALPPFLGQGSNQAIQDAYCLAEAIFDYNACVQSSGSDNAGEVRLQDYLDRYEKTRWLPCFNIFWKSFFLGYLEAGGGKFRDAFFKTMGIIGVAKKVLLGAATPKV